MHQSDSVGVWTCLHSKPLALSNWCLICLVSVYMCTCMCLHVTCMWLPACLCTCELHIGILHNYFCVYTVAARIKLTFVLHATIVQR